MLISISWSSVDLQPNYRRPHTLTRLGSEGVWENALLTNIIRRHEALPSPWRLRGITAAPVAGSHILTASHDPSHQARDTVIVPRPDPAQYRRPEGARGRCGGPARNQNSHRQSRPAPLHNPVICPASNFPPKICKPGTCMQQKSLAYAARVNMLPAARRNAPGTAANSAINRSETSARMVSFLFQPNAGWRHASRRNNGD